MQEIWVVVPTYNEKGNIANLTGQVCDALESVHLKARIVIVDDNSPDGTGREADRLASENPSIKVIHRPEKQGIGPAYLEGFAWAISNGAEWIVQMDCDLSHRPQDLPGLLKDRESYDLIIGSRYVSGGSTSDWSSTRLWMSRIGCWWERKILGIQVRDVSGGFKCWRAESLAELVPHVKGRGFVFGPELNYLAHQKDLRIQEVPIVFQERQTGSSKMSLGIIVEGLFCLIRLRLGRH